MDNDIKTIFIEDDLDGSQMEAVKNIMRAMGLHDECEDPSDGMFDVPASAADELVARLEKAGIVATIEDF